MEGYNLVGIQGPLAEPLGIPLGGPQQEKGPQGPPPAAGAVAEPHIPPIEMAAAEAITARAAAPSCKGLGFSGFAGENEGPP